MSLLWVVRHGQASFWDDNYDKLSPLGEEQAQRLGAYCVAQGARIDHVFSGPLQRQQRTAELAGEVVRAAGLPWPELEIVDALAEMPIEALAREVMPQLMLEHESLRDLIMQFQTVEDREEKQRLFQKGFEIVAEHWQGGRVKSETLEKWEGFHSRVANALTDILDGRHGGKHVAVFTSGGPMAIAVQHALGTTPEKTLELVWRVRNCAISEFLFTDGRITLSAFNTTPHLSEERLVTYR
jgi:broad specificity phosphatase PhoE